MPKGDWMAFKELYERGLLNEEQTAIYEEARNRGLIPEKEKPSRQITLEQVGRPALEAGGLLLGFLLGLLPDLQGN